MKTNVRTFSLLLFLAVLSALFSCRTTPAPVDTDPLWAGALYAEDAAVGTGETVFFFEVEAGTKTVRLTVATDGTNLGRVLLDLGLIAGEDGPFGLYVKSVNGITADYDVDGAWWGLYVDDEMAMTGVDGVTLTAGATYRLVYSK